MTSSYNGDTQIPIFEFEYLKRVSSILDSGTTG
jgi:hypothetical protein